MKLLILMILTHLSAFAHVNYPVKNFQYFSEFDSNHHLEVKDKYLILVFSNKQCLEEYVVQRSCWLFEKKLDYFVPKFGPKIKVLGFNTYFENYRIQQQYQIRTTPTVIFLRNGQQLSRHEADHIYGNWTQGNWQDRLLNEVLNRVHRIR